MTKTSRWRAARQALGSSVFQRHSHATCSAHPAELILCLWPRRKAQELLLVLAQALQSLKRLFVCLFVCCSFMCVFLAAGGILADRAGV